MYAPVCTRPASSLTARRLIGMPVLLLAVAVMAPWLAVNAVVSVAVIGRRAIGSGPRVLLQAIDYAGAVAPGR